MAATRRPAAPRKPRAKPAAKKKAAPRKRGAPTTYSKAKSAEICRRMALGETSEQICKAEGMPTPATLWNWRQAHPDFLDAYARAREDQMHAWSEQIVTLIDDAEPDFVVEAKRSDKDVFQVDGNPDGRVSFRLQRVHLERAKAMVDVRKWLMAKIVPAVFGDRQQVDLNLNMADKDDAELLHELETAAAVAGVSVDELVKMASGAIPKQ